jgi:rhamnose transport system permease protein
MYTDRTRIYSIAVAMVVVCLLLGLVAPGFLSISNAKDILINASTLAIAALGMTLVMLLGQIDISVGAILAIASTAAGYAAQASWSAAAIVATALGVGLLLGLVNGVSSRILQVHSVVVTLGTMEIFRGLQVYWTGGAWLYNMPQAFASIGQGSVLGIPNAIWTTGVVMALCSACFRWTASGRALFAIGSNVAAAKLSGLHANRIMILAFALNGALVGLAAVLQASRFAIIQTNAGVNFEFSVISAVVVGGTSILGGSGSVVGSVLGAIFITTASTALVYMHVSGLWVEAVEGGLVIIVVALDMSRFVFQRQGVQAS